MFEKRPVRGVNRKVAAILRIEALPDIRGEIGERMLGLYGDDDLQ